MYTICIIGGTSPFGQFWKRYFEGKGHTVTIASRSTKISPLEAIKEAHIIIFSLSIRSTIRVVDELIPHVGPDRLIVDFTGIKKDVSLHLAKYSHGEVVATHPMFGPWVSSLQDQNIAYDPIQPGEKWQYLKELWKKDGAHFIEMTSSHHDELVAVVQSSVHILNLVLGYILEKRGISVGELLTIATPNSRMQLCILGRFLSQNASLYTDMQIYNTPYRDEILPEMLHTLEDLMKIVHQDDADNFEKKFNSVKNFIGEDFLVHARTVSEAFDASIKEYFKRKRGR